MFTTPAGLVRRTHHAYSEAYRLYRSKHTLTIRFGHGNTSASMNLSSVDHLDILQNAKLWGLLGNKCLTGNY
jgi:hypothetical protein